MRCKSTAFCANDQIFFVLLRLLTAYLQIRMKKYIKHLGIAALLAGILLFVLHVVLRFRGNTLLLTGLALVVGGVVVFVKGEGLSAASPSDEGEAPKSRPEVRGGGTAG